MFTIGENAVHYIEEEEEEEWWGLNVFDSKKKEKKKMETRSEWKKLYIEEERWKKTERAISSVVLFAKESDEEDKYARVYVKAYRRLLKPTGVPQEGPESLLS